MAVGVCLLPMDKVQPNNMSDDSGSVPIPTDKVQPKNNSNESGSVSMPMDKVQPENNSDDSGSVSRSMDKVQPNNQSEDSVSVSVPMDKIQNNVKVTNDANADKSQMKWMNFLMTPLSIFSNMIWKLKSMNGNIMLMTLMKVVIHTI